MPNYTKNYNFIKPNKTENYDIEDVTNKNMDIIDEELFGKEDKVPGKGLSTNDFTNEYKNKLDGLENYDDTELINKLNEQAQKNNLQEQEIEKLKGQITNLQEENTQLKDQIPTGQAEGESIYLSDSSDLEAKIIVKGNSRQATRTNNLYNNLTNTSGFMGQSGDIVSNTGWVVTDFIPVISSIKYYIAGNKFYTEGSGVYGGFYNSEKELLSTFSYSDYRNETSNITIPEGASYIRFSLYKYQDNTLSFDFYTDSINPNYPSNIETVGSNVNVFDKDNANTISGAYVDSSGNIGNGGPNSQTLYIPITGGKTYTVSKKLTNYGTFRIGTTTEIPALNVQGIDVVSKNGTDTNGTITTSSNANYLTIFCIRTDFDDMQEILDSIKIEQGTKATPYSPYNQGNVEIDIANKNLAKINETDWELTENNTIKNKAKNDGKELTRFNLNKGQTIKIGLKLFQKPTKSSTFTFYVNTQTGVITSFSNYNTYNLNQIYEKTYTATENTEILIRSWGNADNEIVEFQLWAEIDTLTDYIPYQSETKILPIQEEMLEDDYINNENEYHTWGKKILTGNENWVNANRPTDNDIYVSLNVSDLKVYGKAKCSHFKYAYNWTSGTNTIYVGGTRDLFIRIDKNIATDVNIFKTWLQEKYNSGNPVVVYYKLATPKSLPLTEEQKNILNKKTYTYKNITNINTNSIAILDVTYKKDLETLFNQVNQVLIERS